MNTKSAPKNGKIEKRVMINASSAIIYEALTNARDLARWFCDRADSDPREGGELVASWKTGKTAQQGRAVYTHIVPNVELRLRWVDDGAGAIPFASEHTLSYAIHRKHQSCEVVMQDEGDATDEETFSFLDQGWNNVLLELKDYCERKERTGKPHRAAGSV